MFDTQNSQTTTAPGSSFISEDVKKAFTTFAPASYRRESSQVSSFADAMSHGTITFADNKSNRAQFIRIPPNASVKRVKELLIQQWCTERPSLVISITGGAKNYNMKSKLLGAFRRGLLKVAQTTGALIITGGMNSGIMKLVGEIVQTNLKRSRPIHLIGIATWGCVAGVEQLDTHGTNVQYAVSRRERSGEAPLESNHTEFIFIDDGTKRKYGAEIEFRASLEQAISGDFFGPRATRAREKSSPSLPGTQSVRPESDPIPVVLIVVEGGPNTIRTVHEAVVQNNIPAVFIEGTGRCCDLFAKAYRLYKKYRQKFDQPDEPSHTDQNDTAARYEKLKNKLREDLKDELLTFTYGDDGQKDGAGKKPPEIATDVGEKKENKGAANLNENTSSKDDTTEYFEKVYECIHTRLNFLNVIPLINENALSLWSPDEHDIDLAILHALLNVTSGSDSGKTNDQQKREQFRLALEWNRVDIAKNFIMKDDHDWETIDLNDMFESALRGNQTDFVKLFLDHDFSLTNVFRDHHKLLALYPDIWKMPINSVQSSGHPLRAIYEDIIQPKIGDFFQVEAAIHPQKFSASQTDDDDDITSCVCCATPWMYQRHHDSTADRQGGSFPLEAPSFHSTMDIDKELFLWSVVCNRTEFSLLFWSRGRNKICAALIATLLYRKPIRRHSNQIYLKTADHFEELAVQILDKFYETNAYACVKAIIRKIPTYGNVTWLELAIKADAKQFIATAAVQEVLNDIWYGYIDLDVRPTWVVFSTIMLWYSGALHYNDELVQTHDQLTFDDPFDKLTLRERKQRQSAITSRDRTRTRVIRYFRNILKFIRAPYVKFLYSTYFHAIFLLLFSYVVLCKFFPLYDFPPEICTLANDAQKAAAAADNQSVTDNGSGANGTVPYADQHRNTPTIVEWLLAAWVFTLLCEEFRQFYSLESKTIVRKINAYFKVFWNKLDVLSIVLFYIAFWLRFVPVAQCYCAARIILAVDLTLWYMRLLELLAAVKQLGPKLVMISAMVYDLKYYMLMLLIFILGFGVSSYSLMYGVEELNWHLPRKVVNVAYWHIFGDLNSLDEFINNYSANGYIVFLLLLIYMILVSILLVNLLIAMFSYIYESLQKDTDQIWKYQRYSLICEYLSRPSLPPPFIFFCHIWRLLIYLLSQYTKSPYFKAEYNRHKNRNKYHIVLDEKLASMVESAEDALGEEVYYNSIKPNGPEVLETRMQNMQNQISHVFEYLDCVIDSLKVLGGERTKTSERRRLDAGESFDEVVNKFESSKRLISTSQTSLEDAGLQLHNTTKEQQSNFVKVVIN